MELGGHKYEYVKPIIRINQTSTMTGHRILTLHQHTCYTVLPFSKRPSS